MAKVWAHLHLPKWNASLNGSGDFDVISLKSPGQKVRYVSEISLKNCTFFVSAKGRERTLKTGHRNVHAWLIGEPVDRAADYRHWRTAVYDPWKGPNFVDSKTLEQIYFMPFVHMIGKNVYYVE